MSSCVLFVSHCHWIRFPLDQSCSHHLHLCASSDVYFFIPVWLHFSVNGSCSWYQCVPVLVHYLLCSACCFAAFLLIKIKKKKHNQTMGLSKFKPIQFNFLLLFFYNFFSSMSPSLCLLNTLFLLITFFRFWLKKITCISQMILFTLNAMTPLFA